MEPEPPQQQHQGPKYNVHFDELFLKQSRKWFIWGALNKEHFNIVKL